MEDGVDDIDLNDPEVLKAATLIQASFRGFKTRKGSDPPKPRLGEGNDTHLNGHENNEGKQDTVNGKMDNGEDKEFPEKAFEKTNGQEGSKYIVEPSIIVTDTETNTVLQAKDLEVLASDNKNTLEVVHAGDSDWSNVSSRDASPSPDQSAFSAPVNITELNTAATKIQSIFRGYRTRQQIKKHRTNGPAHSRNKSKRRGSGNKDNEDAAATKIQAAFRGFKTRKHMKNTSKPSYRSLPRGMQQRRDSLEAAQREARRGSLTRDVLMASVLEERMQHREVPPEDPALTKAVVTLQAGVRGYLTRKHMAEKRAASDSSNADQINAEAAATKIQAGFRGYKTRKMLRERAQASLDLSDPAVIQAAVRIQAALRGHLARKELRGAS